MNILLENPVTFINAVTPFEAHFIIFCATWLGIITIIWVMIYLLFRPIPDHCVYAPLENLPRRFYDLFLVCFSSIAAYVASFALKNYYQIGRPDLLNIGLRPLLQLSDYGFPSQHAAVFSALAVSLFFINRRAGYFAMLLAVVIGAARVMAGVHTPLDILGGFILGTLIAVLADFVAQKLAFHPLNAKV